MDRFTKKRDPSGLYITIDDELVCSDYGISYEKAVDKKVLQAIDKLGKLEDIEEEIGCPLETLINICNNTQKIVIDETKMESVWKERWKNVKTFIPDSFNITFIYCDVWYEEDFKGYANRLPLPIEEFGKSWWLRKDKSI